MSLLLVPVNVGPTTDPLAEPEYISVAVQDDGDGGQLRLNMMGVNDPTVSGAADLSTFFGTNINEFPIARAFRQLYQPIFSSGSESQQNLAAIQIRKFLSISIYPLLTLQSIVGVGYDAATVNSAQVPFLELISAGIEGGGLWRLDIQLRHTITN